MQKKHILLLSAASVMLMTSCSSKLDALSADNFTVDPNPLEAIASTVPATINGVFPEEYMKKKAVITVTPELRYGDGLVATGTSATFQGEKVEGNDQTISYKLGGNYTMKSTFDYVAAMHKSELYLTFDATVGKKSVEVPEVKIADGVIATSELAKAKTINSISLSESKDAYQRIIDHAQEASIKFLIQQANIRKTELKTNSVTEFVELLKEISSEQDTLALTNIELSAYASPDGKYDYNEKLASERRANTEKYLNEELKKIELEASVDAQYTAEDWDGFQELVKVSDIQDKDVILRVLSMYKDPEEREQQIRNMSSVFQELADGILPELRRSRLVINYQVIGRSDEQIMAQFKEDPSQLSLEELLYAATLTDDASTKEAIYKAAVKQYPDDSRAYNNLAVLAYEAGDYSKAKDYANKALSKDANNVDAKCNLGVIALKEGDVSTAESLISQSSGAENYQEAVGNLHIVQGKYAQAEQDLANVNSNSAALAQILNKDYSAASSTLSNISPADGTTDYLKAILAARQGNSSEAASALKSAKSKDSFYTDFSENDLEFANVNL